MNLQFCKFLQGLAVPVGFTSSVVHGPWTQFVLSNESEDVQYELILNDNHKLVSIGIHFGFLEKTDFNPFKVSSSFFYSSLASAPQNTNRQSYARIKYYNPAYFSSNKEAIDNIIKLLDDGAVLESLVGY